jgi:hypothetical protein
MSNQKQLTLAWLMYADDNQDRLPPNESGSMSRGGWVDGWDSWDAGNTDNTNRNFLTNAKIGPYTKNIGIYKCPADVFLCLMAGRQMELVRSVSMNSFVGCPDPRSWVTSKSRPRSMCGCLSMSTLTVSMTAG